MDLTYDIIVVGGGHAGCEAAYAAAAMGARTVLITMDMTKLAQMSCNPAMGGIAKGQIVREIDALGGVSGIVTDNSMVQFRILNRSKGPAMWSPRAQCDRQLFSIEWRKVLENTDNLHIWQEHAESLLVNNNKVCGVTTSFGNKFRAGAVILTNGTFLNGLMHVGFRKSEGGRSGDNSSRGLSQQLESLGFEVSRMKTGTSARLDGRSIDFSGMIEQKGDGEGRTFSFLHSGMKIRNELSCWVTHTNPDVHRELEKGLEFSPLFKGRIKGIGPRYCPSIEDKIVTFGGREAHQLFIEPEGWNTNEYYVNGFSSSLPADIQLNALRKVPGLENVIIYRPGYAIEYDFFQPTQLYHTLETRKIENLYFAGQINGTTGYEEAAAQGMIAGINAVLKLGGKGSYLPARDESYIGVLIDDLVTKGVDEPYRMFTSRAEYRILLRQDNADERLTEKGYELGIVSAARMDTYKGKMEAVSGLMEWLKTRSVSPEEVNKYLIQTGTAEINQKVKAINLALRPQVKLSKLIEIFREEVDKIPGFIREREEEIAETTEIQVKYSGYIEREKVVAEKIKRLEGLKLPADIEYRTLTSISTEARQKLEKFRPGTIGQASRISGVSPSDISILLLYLGR
jgi:tRNA uridine 5-carboxymethylaminomethyl modification enzyme